HCNYDPVTTMRPQLHATAQTLLYRGIAGKPCFIEEMGTIGPITVSDDLTSSYLRASFLSAWAHDCRAAMWWCAYDQKHLTQAPYDWCLAEEELGFFRKDRSAKPVAQAVKTFSEMLENLPVEFKPLPPRITEGICVLSDDQDQWAVAYGAFLLAKQAGVDIEFQMYDQPLRDAQVYLLPCINGAKPLSRRAWLGLMEKVSEGATLYFSLDQGIVHGLEEATGVEVKTRERVSFECLCRLNNEQEIRIPTDFRYVLEAKRAKVLGADAQGNPIFTEAEYGRGKVFLLTVPLESKWTLQPRALLSESFAAAWKIYSTVFSSKASARAVHVFGEDIGATEHVISSTQRVAIIINHTTTRSSHRFEITKGWSLGTIYRGQVRNNSVDIEPCDAALLILQIESS
ncbi:MAG TPA: hypothetical protein VKC60_00420, partial [Opitutaceae bacterium]|nr:hypothetical protein [Opitutaceae bacterium]